MRRTLKTFLFLALLVLALPTHAQTVTVRVWGIPRSAEGGPFERANRQIIDAFEKKFPAIHLEAATGLQVNGPANESGVLMAIAGGLAPDVMYVNFRQMESYIKQGFLLPLDDLIAQDPRVLEPIHPNIRKVLNVRGHVYAFPYQQWVQALYYRKDFFREAGLDPEHPPRTWDEFYTYAQKLTKPEKGQWGFGFDSSPQGTSWYWVNFLWQAGGEVVRELPDGRWASAFNTPEGVTALKFYRKLVAEEWTLPNGQKQRGVAVRATDVLNDYVGKNHQAMWFEYQSNAIANRASINISPALIGIAPMPKGPTGISANELNASMWGICALQKDPKVQQAAWEFVKYMGSDEADAIRTRAYIDAGLGMYLSPLSLKKHGYLEYVTGANKEWLKATEELFKNGKPEPFGENCQLIYTELDQPLVEIGLYPDHDPTEVLNRAAKTIDAKLLGYVEPEVQKRRRQIALGAVTGGFALILGLGVLMIRRLSMAITDTEGSRMAGTNRFRYHLIAWVFMLPAVGSIALWAYFPLARGLLMAFQDYRIAAKTRWIGLDNFIEVATQETFWKGILHSLEYVGLTLGLGFCLPILLALLLAEIPRGKMLYRSLYYLPAVTSGLVIAFLWKQFYAPTEQGLFNQMLHGLIEAWNTLGQWLHLPLHLKSDMKIDWLGDPTFAMLAVVLPVIWAGAGPGSILYLAALKSISEDVYEAADIDGASIWHKIRYITVPSLRPLIMINFVGAFIGSFKAMENIFVMTGGGPLYRTHTIGLEIWYNAFMYLKFGYATAAAWIMGAMLVGFTLYQLRLLRNIRFTANN